MQLVDLTGTYGRIAYPRRSIATITDVIVHHADGRQPKSEADARQAIAEIHAFHRDTRGWPGFAYNGAIWRGYAWLCRPYDRKGWHSAGRDRDGNGIGDGNDRGVAWVLLGDYEHATPHPETLQTLAEVKALVDRAVGRELLLTGHRDWWGTSCPGTWWTRAKDLIPTPRKEAIVVTDIPEQYRLNGWHDWRTAAINLQGIADALGVQIEDARRQLADCKSADEWRATIGRKDAAMQQAVEILRGVL